jgi:hypothetical protein
MAAPLKMADYSLEGHRPGFYRGLSDFIRYGNRTGLDELFQDGFDPAIAAIYRNGFYRSCREVLASSYPSVRHQLGDDTFATLARRYATEHPPGSGTLTGYGRGFPEWLALQLSPPQDWLVSMARLDWAWLDCLHGEDATPLGAQGLRRLAAQGTDITRLSVSPLPNARLVSCTAEGFGSWSDLKRGQGLIRPESAITAQSRTVLMWRPEMKVYARALSELEDLFLAELNRHRSLDKASAALLEAAPGFDLASHFAELLTHGVLQLDHRPVSEPGNK